MIENEMAKLEKLGPRAVQVLAVPELGKVFFVVGKLCRFSTTWKLLGSKVSMLLEARPAARVRP